MESTKCRILMAVMKGVRQRGLEGVRVQHISALAGLTPGAIYRHFKSKDELMAAAFFYVDRQAAELFEHVDLDPATIAHDPLGAVKKLWLPYFRFWTSRPDETVFYHRFRDSAYFPRFDQERDVAYFASFAGMVQAFYKEFPKLSQLNKDLLWLHVLTGTVLYAKYVVEGVLPNNQETEDAVFSLLATGLSCYLA